MYYSENGDDFNDTEALGIIGFSVTLSDGHIQNKKIVDYVCRKKRLRKMCK